jgi:hypothetical protein
VATPSRHRGRRRAAHASPTDARALADNCRRARRRSTHVHRGGAPDGPGAPQHGLVGPLTVRVAAARHGRPRLRVLRRGHRHRGVAPVGARRCVAGDAYAARAKGGGGTRRGARRRGPLCQGVEITASRARAGLARGLAAEAAAPRLRIGVTAAGSSVAAPDGVAVEVVTLPLNSTAVAGASAADAGAGVSAAGAVAGARRARNGAQLGGARGTGRLSGSRRHLGSGAASPRGGLVGLPGRRRTTRGHGDAPA